MEELVLLNIPKNITAEQIIEKLIEMKTDKVSFRVINESTRKHYYIDVEIKGIELR